MNALTLAPLLGGLAVGSFIIAAFFPFDGAADSGKKMKSRMKAVANRREQLRELHKVKGKPGREVDDKTTRMMRRTVEKFQMEELINSTEVRMKLARAGFRGQRAATMFLFFRIIAPFGLAALAMLYFALLSKGAFEPLRHSMIALGIMFAGYMLPMLYVNNLTQKRQKEMGRAYPDALDLMVICVESGMSIENAFNKVATEIAPQSKALAEEIGLTTAELAYLGDRKQAYENFALRTDMAPVKALTGALIQAEQYGTPLGQALRVLSDESRGERMSLAERKAASLPAKLTVPMILFFLPVLFVVIIGPSVIQVMGLE